MPGQNYYDNLLACAADGIVATTPWGKITYVNPAVYRLTGFSSSALIGKPVHRLLVGGLKELNRLRRTLKIKSSAANIHTQLCTQNGGQLYVSVSISFLYDADGKKMGALGIFKDITERKLMEEMQENLFYFTAHDLKQPVQSILGYSESMIDGFTGSLNPLQAKMVKGIYSQIIRCKFMIEDMLDSVRVDENKLPMNLSSCQVQEIVAKVYGLTILEANMHNIHLEYEIEPELPAVIWDSYLIERILINLVENAIKFVDANGKIKIIVKRHDARNVTITVKDSGPGISVSDLPLVFDRFKRLQSKSLRAAGTGLGLFIVKTLAEMHQGRVDVESTVGVGTTFFVYLPIEARQFDVPQSVA